MADHEIVKCSCGNLIAQCRCSHADKPVRVVEYGCGNCQEILRQQPQLATRKKEQPQPEKAIC